MLSLFKFLVYRLGFRLQSVWLKAGENSWGLRPWDSGFKGYGLGFWAQGLHCWVQVQGLVFRVEGLWCGIHVLKTGPNFTGLLPSLSRHHMIVRNSLDTMCRWLCSQVCDNKIVQSTFPEPNFWDLSLYPNLRAWNVAPVPKPRSQTLTPVLWSFNRYPQTQSRHFHDWRISFVSW